MSGQELLMSTSLPDSFWLSGIFFYKRMEPRSNLSVWINDLSCTECAVSVITIISVGLCIHICRTLEQLTAVLDEILDNKKERINNRFTTDAGSMFD
uniref:Uncharacterized protein n=1 Tax=Physcomitrium patens TaxID=3218 RepID=A0A2K1JCW7_PHYPA|nr:hypothetical protein PHYPA_019637 [Physcomitrium patens]